MSYQKLARLYDFLMEDAPYDQWVSFTESFLDQQSKSHKPKILDLGCGTGQITWRLADRGYQMTGVDLSEDMLTEAAARASDKNISIQWLQQDMTKLTGLSQFDLAISYCDVVNYLTDKEQLKQAFERIYQSLSPEGIFLFDVHSLEHVQNQMADQLFSEVYDDLAYIWFCYGGDQPGEMTHELTFFSEENGVYHRFEEVHQQKTHSITVYLELLKAAGFKAVDVFTDFNTEPIDDLSIEPVGDRIFFACRKEG